MKWLNKIFDFFRKGSYEPIYSLSGTWDINLGNSTFNEYCNYVILYNKVKNHYKLEVSGYRPKNHTRYEFMFNATVSLNEGLLYAKGGKLYETNGKEEEKEDDLNIETLNETQCEAHLKKALQDEDYELAEKLRLRLEKLR